MINDKKNLRDDDDAVSPVIGVILMVAITVIMAAVIGAFVYGYGGSMVQAKDVAATARHQGESIYVTYMGGPDQALVSTLEHNIGQTSFSSMATVVGTTASQGSMTGTSNHVIVKATFTDGTSQVILDTFC